MICSGVGSTQRFYPLLSRIQVVSDLDELLILDFQGVCTLRRGNFLQGVVVGLESLLAFPNLLDC